MAMLGIKTICSKIKDKFNSMKLPDNLTEDEYYLREAAKDLLTCIELSDNNTYEQYNLRVLEDECIEVLRCIEENGGQINEEDC